MHHTACLAAALARRGPLHAVGFDRLFPDALYPGEPPYDPSHYGPRLRAPRLLRPLAPGSWWTTARALAAGGPAAVVVQYWHPYFAPATLGVLRALKRLSPTTRRLVLCHNALPHDRFPLQRQLATAVLGEADAVLAHGNAGVQAVEQLVPGQSIVSIAHPRYHPLSPAPPVDRIDARRLLGLDDGPRLLFFGHVRAYKGLDLLLRALARLPAETRPRLLVSGAWLIARAPIDTLIWQLGLSDHVDIRPGYVSNEALPAVFGAADAVVLPYRSATQSGVVQLAFALGRPAIVTDVGSLAEAVHHEEDGLIVSANDDAELAAAIARFFANGLGTMMERALQRPTEDGWDTLAAILAQRATDSARG